MLALEVIQFLILCTGICLERQHDRQSLKTQTGVHTAPWPPWFHCRILVVLSDPVIWAPSSSKVYMLMKSCFSGKETANCLIIQVFTLMKHYSMDLEHGVQPNYHPSTQAVKSDYSLASQWVVQTSFPPQTIKWKWVLVFFFNSTPVLLIRILDCRLFYLKNKTSVIAYTRALIISMVEATA